MGVLMKGKAFLIPGVILVFGLFLSGCATDVNIEIDNTKSLKITGLPTGQRGIYIGVSPGPSQDNVACGWVNLQSNPTEITIKLKVPINGGDYSPSSPDWTGSGEYYLFLNVSDGIDNIQYFYSNGDPIALDYSGVKKFNFDETLKTVDFSKFYEPGA